MINRSNLVFVLRNPKRLIRILGHRGFFNFVPDLPYLKLVYWAEMGKSLNIENPQTFNEKIQWLKLYNRNPKNTKYVDKYEVRRYIAETIGEQYLIPLINVYDEVNEINWDSLPNSFVLKCTHGSGSNIICKDKNNLDINLAKKKLKRWMNQSWYYFGREWEYKNIKPRIICEKYIVDNHENDLKDYKIMCFNGKAKCIFVCLNRNSKNGLNINIYDKNWNLLPFERNGAPNSKEIVKKPKNLELMLELAEVLAKEFPFLRVDFYDVNDKIYFGEMTFYPGSGFRGFTPEQYDEILGSWINLPIESKNNIVIR